MVELEGPNTLTTTLRAKASNTCLSYIFTAYFMVLIGAVCYVRQVFEIAYFVGFQKLSLKTEICPATVDIFRDFH